MPRRRERKLLAGPGSGDLEEGREAFAEQAVDVVGLLSEEIYVRAGELLGSFPRGFSHMTLITSAANLAKTAKHGAEAHSQTEAEHAGPARRAASEHYVVRQGGRTTS